MYTGEVIWRFPVDSGAWYLWAPLFACAAALLFWQSRLKRRGHGLRGRRGVLIALAVLFGLAGLLGAGKAAAEFDHVRKRQQASELQRRLGVTVLDPDELPGMYAAQRKVRIRSDVAGREFDQSCIVTTYFGRGQGGWVFGNPSRGSRGNGLMKLQVRCASPFAP